MRDMLFSSLNSVDSVIDYRGVCRCSDKKMKRFHYSNDSVQWTWALISNVINTILKELLPLTETLQEQHDNRKKILEDRKFLSSSSLKLVFFCHYEIFHKSTQS